MMPENTKDVRDSSLLELFYSEVKTYTAALREGLLALQNGSGTVSLLDRLIRAVHSIKGGARIVDVTVAAEIAQVLEEYFSAVQRGEISLNAEQIDLLLKSTDMIDEIAEAMSDGLEEWIAGHRETINRLLAEIIESKKSNVQTADQTANTRTSARTATSDSGSAEASDAPGSEPLSAGIADVSMLELLQTEVETHTATLSEGLLALENTPTATDKLEALMRAAHSIKGGARVVGLDAVVRLAHVMEDCFVAAQSGKILLNSSHIDTLFQSVDLLRQIVGTVGDGAANEPNTRKGDVERLVASLSAILSGEPVITAVSRQTPPPAIPAPTTPKPPVKSQIAIPHSSDENGYTAQTSHDEKSAARTFEEKDRMVRVTATKIDRLMGLGGEVVVSARWLPPFSQSLLGLKKTHNELFTLLEKLRDVLGEEGAETARKLVIQAYEKTRDCSNFLADRITQFDMFTSMSANLSDRLYHEVVSVRMRPFSDGVRSFPRMVRDLAKKLGKKAKLEIVGKSTEVDRDILEKLDAPLTHLLRNALDHGIESPEERAAIGKPEMATLRMEAVHRAGMLMITVADDGRGIDLDRLRQKILHKGLAGPEIVEKLTETELTEFLFLPGFSTSDNVTEISGRGVGLDVVHNMTHEVGGVVRVVSKPGKGVTFHLELPLTLSVIRTFLVEIANEAYAFPLARIERCVMLSEQDVEIVEERQYFKFDNNNIALIDIRDVLDIGEPGSHYSELPVVVVSDRTNLYGLLVDKFLGEYDLVVRPLDPRLGKVPDISAAAVMLDGSPVLIFDVEDMIRSIDNLVNERHLHKVNELAQAAKDMPIKRILVVDDSITVREMERKLLENRKYHVEVAVDGMEGWNAVRTNKFDLVISDIDMPRMNGIEFIKNIRQHEDLKSLPVIIISYKDSEEHRLQGLEAGANYYLTKSSFQDDSFINAVVDLIGEAS